MAFKFRCPECGVAMIAAADSAGSETHCPSCLATFVVPEPGNQPPAREPERRRSSSDEDDPPREERESEYSDDPEPRPRRRRRSPPPRSSGGYSALTVIGILFGVLFLGSCACCGGGYLMLPGEQWRTHQSPQGGYSVEIPVEPKQNMAALGVKPEPGVHVEGGLLWKRGECYVVTYVDRPAFSGQSDEELLRDMVREMQRGPEIKRTVREVPITVSGYPGREVEFIGDDGGWYLARLVVTERRAFIVLGGGRFVKADNPNIRRFVESFKVTTPRIPQKPWNVR
jgi:hypothetical protein